MKSTKSKRSPAPSRPMPKRPVARGKLTVGEIMSKEVVTVSPELNLRETVELLADRHISGAPVVSGGRIVGVISTSDLLEFEASTPGVPAERPDQVEEAEWGAAEEFQEGGEPPAAFFTEMWSEAEGDVRERFEQVLGAEWDWLAEHSVVEVMNRRLCVVPAKADIADAADYMLRAGIHRLLVKDGKHFVGIVTTTDILRAVIAARGSGRPLW